MFLLYKALSVFCHVPKYAMYKCQCNEKPVCDCCHLHGSNTKVGSGGKGGVYAVLFAHGILKGGPCLQTQHTKWPLVLGQQDGVMITCSAASSACTNGWDCILSPIHAILGQTNNNYVTPIVACIIYYYFFLLGVCSEIFS